MTEFLPTGLADRVQKHIATSQDRWVKTLSKLVSIPSPLGQETELVECVAHEIMQTGAELIRIPHDPRVLESLPAAQQPIRGSGKRCSLVARIKGAGRGRSLALNAHLDIIPEGEHTAWTHPPYEGHVDREKGILYGRGALDDKAGVVICLALMEMIIKTPVPLAGDLLFHLVLEDETTGNGTLLCWSMRPPR